MNDIKKYASAVDSLNISHCEVKEGFLALVKTVQHKAGIIGSLDTQDLWILSTG